MDFEHIHSPKVRRWSLWQGLHTCSIYLQTVHPTLGRWHLKCKQRLVKPRENCHRASPMSQRPRSPALWLLEGRATQQEAFAKVSLTDPKRAPTKKMCPPGGMHVEGVSRRQFVTDSMRTCLLQFLVLVPSLSFQQSGSEKTSRISFVCAEGKQGYSAAEAEAASAP